MSNQKVLYILVNSPGEVCGWAAPVVQRLHQMVPDLAIIAVTLPCPYASGGEKQAALALGVQDVVTLGQLLKRKLPRVKKGQSDFAQILQLGGDAMWGLLLHIKTGYDWLIYTKRPKFRHFVHHYFVPNRETAEKFAHVVSPDKFSLAGNLILDSVKLGYGSEGREGELRLVILPGSRPFEYTRSIPFYLEVSRLLHEKFPALSITFPLAPTVKEEACTRAIEESGCHYAKDEATGDLAVQISQVFKVRFTTQNTFNEIKHATLAVAFPGTNNLQIAYLGTPLLCLAPTNFAEEIPLDGLLGLIPNCAITRKLKRLIIDRLNRRIDFTSLPNILAKRQVVPEVRRFFSVEDGAETIATYLASEKLRNDIKEAYRFVPFDLGADRVIAEFVTKSLK